MSHMQQMLIGSATLVAPPALHTGTFNTVGYTNLQEGQLYYGFSRAYPAQGSYTDTSGYECQYFKYSTLVLGTIVSFFQNISGGSPIIITVNGNAQTFTWSSTYSYYIKDGDPFSLVASYPSSPNWSVSVET